MKTKNTIFVTGASGNQGGAVARSLLHKGFTVKALTRDPSSQKLKFLNGSYAQIVKGDLDNPETYRDYLKDVEGVFSVQTFMNGTAKEIRQSTDLADMAKSYGIKHFLYSSVAGADRATGIPQFESKFFIENHIRQSGLPYTIIRPSSLFENFLVPQVKNGILKGKLTTPVKRNTVQQFIGATDIGEMSAKIFTNRMEYLGKTITIGTEELDMDQVVAAFSEVLNKEVRYQKLPPILARLFLGKNLYKMFRWLNENDALFMNNLETFRRENPGLMGLKEWITINFSEIH